MMKKHLCRLLVAATCAAMLAGCAVIGSAPVTAPIVIAEKGPVSAGSAAGSAKVGTSEAWGILIFATGDASISKAMQNGGITRVHHVDHETTNILGLWAKYTTIVYGE